MICDNYLLINPLADKRRAYIGSNTSTAPRPHLLLRRRSLVERSLELASALVLPPRPRRPFSLPTTPPLLDITSSTTKRHACRTRPPAGGAAARGEQPALLLVLPTVWR